MPAINHVVKKNQRRASLDRRKKPDDHDCYLWGTSTNMIPTEKEISLGVNNAESFLQPADDFFLLQEADKLNR